MLVDAIAGELGLPYIKVSGPALVGSLSGESEQKLRDLFAAAAALARAAGGAVLFIDDIDAVTPKLGESGSVRGMERRMVAQLMACMDALAARPPPAPPPAAAEAAPPAVGSKVGVEAGAEAGAEARAGAGVGAGAEGLDGEGDDTMLGGGGGASSGGADREPLPSLLAATSSESSASSASSSPPSSSSSSSSSSSVAPASRVREDGTLIAPSPWEALGGASGAFSSFPSAAAPVVVIGATCRPDAVDGALRRAGRFDREVGIPIPDQAARRHILEVLCAGMRLDLSGGAAQGGESTLSSAPGSGGAGAGWAPVDLDLVAKKTPGFVGADLMALAKEAGMLAIDRLRAALPPGRLLPPVALLGHRVPGPSSAAAAAAAAAGLPAPSPGAAAAATGDDGVSVAMSVALPAGVVALGGLGAGVVAALGLDELAGLAVRNEDFLAATKVVQPTAKREGFATAPDVTWDDIGALSAVRGERGARTCGHARTHAYARAEALQRLASFSSSFLQEVYAHCTNQPPSVHLIFFFVFALLAMLLPRT